MFLLLACARPIDVPPMDQPDPVARGEALYHQGGCIGCHYDDLSGGRDNPTVFGTFYAPNISPHADGLEGWTEADFFRAMRHGQSPEGTLYWPTFAYMAFTKMSDDDVAALWAYVSSREPVAGTVPANEPDFPAVALRVWRSRELDVGPLEPDPAESEAWNRGRYLVQAVGYCDQCHTPRNRMGFLDRDLYMAGGANPGKDEIHPNLTTLDWTVDELASYLSDGIAPDGTPTREDWVMHEKIADSTSWYSQADREAIATYVLSLEPRAFDPEAHFADW